MVKNAVLRYNARKQLGENIFRDKWLIMLAVCAILPLCTSLLSSCFVICGVSTIIISGILTILISGPLIYGVARTAVECVEGKKWDISHAFCGFKEDFCGAFALGFFAGIVFNVLDTFAYYSRNCKIVFVCNGVLYQARAWQKYRSNRRY